jgi:hypothetical protein
MNPSQEAYPPINEARSVAFALPQPDWKGQGGGILRSTPLLDPPEGSLDDPEGLIIGRLEAGRDLPLSDGHLLAPGLYWVKVRQGYMVFIAGDDREIVTDLPADIRPIETRTIDPPETAITLKDVSYAWNDVQVCTEPSALMALSEEEYAGLRGKIADGVQALVSAGLIAPGEINLDGTVPDVVGEVAMADQHASALVAPIVAFPAGGDMPAEGMLLGVFQALEAIDEHGFQPGPYAVYAHQGAGDQWFGQFKHADGPSLLIPGTYIEARGQTVELDGAPLAILIGFRIFLCFFEC